jgi:hypothetical protein
MVDWPLTDHGPFSADFLHQRRWCVLGPMQVPGYLPIVRTTDPSGHGSWMAGED